MAKNESGVLYLEKDRLFFYDGEKVFKLDFTPDTVRDLDLVNEDLLANLILQFIDRSKINPANYVFVIAEPALFTQESAEKDQAKLEAQFQNFIDLVPFNSVLAKKYPTAGGSKFVAVNQELVIGISESFEQRGFVRDGIVPAMIFSQIAGKKGLDADSAEYILANQNLVKGRSMLEATQSVQKEEVAAPAPGAPAKSKTLPYLLAGFGVLLIILVIVILLRR